MSENLKLSEGQRPDSHKRILKIMAVIAAAGTLFAFAVGGVNAGFGFVLGCGLSLVNYLWLESSLRAMFSGSTSTGTMLVAARYIFRYFLLGAVLLIVYLTDTVPMASVIAGLAAFAMAAVIQGFRSISSIH